MGLKVLKTLPGNEVRKVEDENLTDAEKFILSLGDVAYNANPKILQEDNDLTTRQMCSLGAKILGAMALGKDKYGMGNINFDAFKREYRRLKK